MYQTEYFQKYTVKQEKGTPPKISVDVAKDQSLKFSGELAVDQPEVLEIEAGRLTQSLAPLMSANLTPDTTRMVYTVQHVTSVPEPMKTMALYEDEFMIWGGGIFIPEEPFEYQLDLTNAVKALTQLVIVRSTMNANRVFIKMVGMINIPSWVSSFAPTITMRCLTVSPRSWYGVRRCSLRVAFPRPSSTGSLFCVIGVKEDDSLVPRDSDSDSSIEYVSNSEVDQ